MSDHPNITRRVPIDFNAIAKESGLSAGKLAYSPHFGWGVQNTKGVDGPDFGCVTPPELEPGEVRLTIEDNHWCFYSPSK